jgi:hypothetical protein
MQTVKDWQLCISYETEDWATDPAGHQIECALLDYPNKIIFNGNDEAPWKLDTQMRWEGIQKMEPADDDIIIFLDLDGDRFAHPDVLAHLLDYYADDTLATYGSYLPDPPEPGCPPAREYPPEVIANRSYRAFGAVYFNHLRTMKGRIFNNVPVDQFHYDGGPKIGAWYEKGCDVQFTLTALELAGPRFKFITETLMYYKSDNPLANWRIDPEGSNECNIDFMRRPPLPVL